MIFRQLIHDDLGCASYLIGDEDAGVAAVVDPKFEIGEYLALARYMGVRIEHVLETHNHADHVSGHGRLAAATGATIHIHRLATPDYEHEPFDDGWELQLGSVTVRALHTPGHRPEHTAFALVDTARGPEPWAVLSGDTLFVGDIARPDLAVEKREGASRIFHSLRDTLLALPAECEVWPGHLGGSLCGGPGMDMKICSTIAYEHAHNELLQIEDEDEFVRATTSTLGPQPPNFQAIVALNRGALLTAAVEIQPLTPRQVEQREGEGAFIVDVRTDLQFDAAHLAAAVGIRNIAGYLSGGMTSWREEQRPTRSLERIDVTALHARRDEVQVLDVRERSEWDQGHITGSIHTPYHDIHGIPDGIDPGQPVAIVCSSGQRSAIAASLLLRHGARRVIHVADGGVGTWARHGWTVEGPNQRTASVR